MVIETGDRPAAKSKSRSGPATPLSEGEMIERNALGLPLDSVAPRGLLESMPGETRRGVKKREAATWHDVVRCTCYISDIERDYADFNAIRTEFFSALDLLPASTAIQARLCRSDLLVELDAHAILDVSSPRA